MVKQLIFHTIGQVVTGTHLLTTLGEPIPIVPSDDTFDAESLHSCADQGLLFRAVTARDVEGVGLIR